MDEGPRTHAAKKLLAEREEEVVALRARQEAYARAGNLQMSQWVNAKACAYEEWLVDLRYELARVEREAASQPEVWAA